MSSRRLLERSRVVRPGKVARAPGLRPSGCRTASGFEAGVAPLQPRKGGQGGCSRGLRDPQGGEGGEVSKAAQRVLMQIPVMDEGMAMAHDREVRAGGRVTRCPG